MFQKHQVRTKCRLSDESLLEGVVPDSLIRRGYLLRYPFPYQARCADEQRSFSEISVLPLAASLSSSTLREISAVSPREYLGE